MTWINIKNLEKLIKKIKADEMLNVGFEIVPFDKVKENSCILVASRYRESKVISSDWKMLELDKIFSSIKNGVNVNQTDNIGKYRVSRIQTISDGMFNIEKTKWTNDDVNEKNFLNEGDILLSHINSYEHLAKSALFYGINDKVVHGTNLIRLIPNKEIINPKFASYMLKTRYFVDSAKQFAQRAVNQASIKVSDLKTIKIPVPTMEVQEETVKELDVYQNIINSAKIVINSYVPSIQIDPKWGSTTLKNIVEEIKPGFACGTHGNYDNEVIHIRPMNITTAGMLTLDGCKFINAEILGKKSSYLLKKGDILFNNTNSKELVGKTCYVEKDIQALYSNHITRIRVNKNKVNYKFLAIYLHTIWKKGYFYERCRKWVGQAGIDVEELNNLEIRLPNIEIQNLIVSQIERELQLVEPSKDLIEVFTKKIDDRLSKFFI